MNAPSRSQPDARVDAGLDAGLDAGADIDDETDPSDASDVAVSDASSVKVVVVAHDPGPWFDECLQSIRDQDLPGFSVLVVDAGSAEPVEPRVRAILPSADVERLAEPVGFGPAVNAVLPAVSAFPYLLLCHDDVRLRNDALRELIVEARASNASILGPKLVAWEDERVLVHVGASVDKTGVQAPFAEHGEMDQEQHDAVRDVALVPGAVQLIRTDLLLALEGFDPEMDLVGEDLDLCWRSVVAGARALVVPSAVAAHRSTLFSRREIDDRRRRLARTRLRTILVCYGPWHLVRVLPQAFILGLVEIVVAVALGHFGQARDVASAWAWNLRRLGQVRGRRAALKKLRRVPDREIRRMHVGGSARLNSFVRGQITSDRQRGGIAALQRALAAPGLRVVVSTVVAVGAYLAFGSRHLITRGVPDIGEVAGIPEGTEILQRVLASFNPGWMGSDAPAPTSLVLMSVPAYLFGGGWFRTLLLIGLLPLGALGAWRLGSVASYRPVAAACCASYLAIPLGTEAMANGSWSGALVWATAPWVLVRLGRIGAVAPFESLGRSWAREAVSTGVLVAVVIAFVPSAAVAILAVAAGVVLGGILALSPRGTIRLLFVGCAAAFLALLLQGAWLIELGRAGWNSLVGPRALATGDMTLTQIISLDVWGGGGVLPTRLLIVPACVPLLIGRDWRFAWAVRSWSVMLVSWGLAWAAVRGWIPFPLPEPAVLLTPAALGLSMAAALAVAVARNDLPDYHLGWRQVVAVAGLAPLVLVAAPTASRALDGRWGMPAGSFSSVLGFAGGADSGEESGIGRVLWIGDPALLTGDVREVVPGTSMVVSTGMPTIADSWPANPTVPDERLRLAVRRSILGGSGRMGSEVGGLGVRWIIAPQRTAPHPFTSRARPTDEAVLEALAEQLDLVRIEVNAAVVVYRNEAWIPPVAAIGGDAIGGDAIDGDAIDGDATDGDTPVQPGPAPAAAADSAGDPEDGSFSAWSVRVGKGGLIRLSSGSRHWNLTAAGDDYSPKVVSDGVMEFGPVSSDGAATVSHEPASGFGIALSAQILAWAMAILLLLRWRNSEERLSPAVARDSSNAAGVSG